MEKLLRFGSIQCQKKSLTLLNSQIDDVYAALRILPEGKSLYQAVCIAFSNLTSSNLDNLVSEFNKAKAASGVCVRHLNIVKGRTKSLLQRFKSFDAISSKSVFEFIATKGSARKTTIEWFNTLNDFFKFCIRRDALNVNPLDKWTINDFGRTKSKRQHKFISVDTAENFIHFIQTRYSVYLKYFVLTMFAGIRVAEVLRIIESYIDYTSKSISLPAEITKKNRAEYLDDFEPNLWAWLELCKNMKIISPSSNTRKRIYEKFSLSQNFARHSFATYHYSLYRDPKRTAAITHHTEQQLMNDYMDALVSKEIAEAYFKILPKDFE